MFSIILDHFSLDAFILLLTFILCFALCSLVAARSHCYLHLVLFGLDSAHLSTDCLVIKQEGDEVIDFYSKNSVTFIFYHLQSTNVSFEHIAIQ